jgi:hypothetical protein
MRNCRPNWPNVAMTDPQVFAGEGLLNVPLPSLTPIWGQVTVFPEGELLAVRPQDRVLVVRCGPHFDQWRRALPGETPDAVLVLTDHMKREEGPLREKQIQRMQEKHSRQHAIENADPFLVSMMAVMDGSNSPHQCQSRFRDLQCCDPAGHKGYHRDSFGDYTWDDESGVLSVRKDASDRAIPPKPCLVGKDAPANVETTGLQRIRGGCTCTKEQITSGGCICGAGKAELERERLAKSESQPEGGVAEI